LQLATKKAGEVMTKVIQLTRFIKSHLGNDLGMISAEYAMGTIAACGFAGGLFKILTGAAAQDVLWTIVKKALSVFVPW
jgi:hypothetical protein